VGLELKQVLISMEAYQPQEYGGLTLPYKNAESR